MGDACGAAAEVYAERARRLKLPFAETVRLCMGGRSVNDEAIQRGAFAMAADGTAYVAPEGHEIPAIEAWLRAHPEARERLWVTTPGAIRAALTKASAPRLLDVAVNRLSEWQPAFSARRTLTVTQVLAGVVAVTAVGLGLFLAPGDVAMAGNLFAALLFFSVSALRFLAAGLVKERNAPPIPVVGDQMDFPVYTVLVPLHREADLVADVVRAMLGLDWPRDKLDVKLLVEAGDKATVTAARKAAQGTDFEIVVVPAGAPRTKPRALAYALPLARGEFVTVFDAEDRPHPVQLRTAWETFRRGPPNLACVQAALVIDNEEEGWLPLLFAIEYAALFDGLLPCLAAMRMPVPLGGTSNHFRRRALDKIGGWDCYNVTEDADVGIRLARFGYRTEVINLPTFEDAPVGARTWLRQRTRWFKGWLQTWLVHTRQPVRLVRELGARGALGFTLMSAGTVVSAMVYPVYLATVLLALVRPLEVWQDGGAAHAAAVGIYLFNLIAGHGAMALLSLRTLRKRARGRLAWGILLLPAYWLFMSVAAYRAVVELAFRPHYWAKTPHRRHRRRAVAEGRQRVTPRLAGQGQALPAAGS